MQSAGGDLGPYDRNAAPEKCDLSLQTAWRGLLAHSVRIAVPGFDHQLPGANVALITQARKFCYPEATIRINHTRFRPSATERSPRSNQHSQPVATCRWPYCLDHVPAPRLQPPIPAAARTAVRRAICCRGNRHHLQREIEGPPHEIRHVRQEVVGFDQPPFRICSTSTLITLQTTFHQQSSPSVWTCVSKQTECLTVRWMLPPAIETQPRIQRNACYLRIRYRSLIELEVEDFLAPSCMGVQRAQSGCVRERLPDPHTRGCFWSRQRTFLPTGETELIRSANASELEKPPCSIQLLSELAFEISE